MNIILASSNEHKVKEINLMIKKENINFILPPSNFSVIEDGKTFEENSYIKALAAWNICKNWTLADDSGLCIDALNGEPGIHSARYDSTPEKRIQKVLNKLKNVSDNKRTAHFKCCMTLLDPQGEIALQAIGICRGSIIKETRGINGFGYDPIFLLENSSKTLAELSDTEKNQVSHRSKALKQIIEFCNSNIL